MPAGPYPTKEQFLAHAARLTALEQGGGGAAPTTGALAESEVVSITLPGSGTAPVSVSSVTFTPNAEMRAPGSYAQMLLPGAAGLAPGDAQVTLITTRGEIPLTVTGTDAYLGGSRLTVAPFAFGYTGDALRVSFTAPVSVTSAAAAFSASLDAEVRGAGGDVLAGTVVGVELTGTPVTTAPGPLSPGAMPVTRVPTGFAYREGHTELVLEAGQVPVLRVFHEGQWYAQALALEGAGGQPV
ncbi:hypothetical protein [Deinococcus soli (ex Cha et al. 2016)]|uniref:hypothetical protein n=1 Tax=Deinococcus soli (ex Cha et al. 2016) TaxID=1309411 RepID=UPI00166B744E|nr:hypothetical protein [Deinococcus soli (ex Cha et al. 2016)]GGB69603.1 hypothetical protein GCM10008019_27250 [Deinococcus soli (ex Cha et al. 2016)]